MIFFFFLSNVLHVVIENNVDPLEERVQGRLNYLISPLCFTDKISYYGDLPIANSDKALSPQYKIY